MRLLRLKKTIFVVPGIEISRGLFDTRKVVLREQLPSNIQESAENKYRPFEVGVINSLCMTP